MSLSLGDLEQRLIALERQIAALVSSAAGDEPTRLMAPVEVVSPEGHLLLRIEQRLQMTALSLYNAAGYAVATLGIDGTQAGFLTIRDAADHIVASLDVETAGARLIVQDAAGVGGVILFGGDSGADEGGGIHVCNTHDGLSMSVWATATGGQMIIYDREGNEQDIVAAPDPS